MRPRSLSQPRVFFAIACYLNTAILGSSTILCVGSDGHMAYEFIGATCCEPPSAGIGSDCEGCGGGCERTDGEVLATEHGRAHGTDPERPAQAPSPCGGCTDISIDAASLPASSPRAHEAAGDSAVASVCIETAGSSDIDELSTSGTEVAPAPPRGSLLHLKSTVLRR